MDGLSICGEELFGCPNSFNNVKIRVLVSSSKLDNDGNPGEVGIISWAVVVGSNGGTVELLSIMSGHSKNRRNSYDEMRDDGLAQ